MTDTRYADQVLDYIDRTKGLLRRCRSSVLLDAKAHERLASTSSLGPATAGIHAQEAQKLRDLLIEIDETLETRG